MNEPPRPAGAVAGALASPLAARAQQQPDRVRRIGVLLAGTEGDTLIAPSTTAFREGLQRAGWVIGRDVQIETRWAEGSAEKARKAAGELIALKPDVIVVAGTAAEALLQIVRDVPVVFVIVVDPLGSGFIESLSHPGGNVTGFMLFDYNLSAKWAELLKQIAPGVTRVGVIRDPSTTAGIGQFAVIQSVAPTLGIEIIPIGVRNAADIEHGLTALARGANGGLIVASGAAAAFRSPRCADLRAQLGQRSAVSETGSSQPRILSFRSAPFPAVRLTMIDRLKSTLNRSSFVAGENTHTEQSRTDLNTR